MGTVHPAITAPSAAGESLIASTAKASAMPDIELPAELTSWPRKNHRNAGTRSGAVREVVTGAT